MTGAALEDADDTENEEIEGEVDTNLVRVEIPSVPP